MRVFAKKVKLYYERDLWTLERVQKALEVEAINQEEYDEIVAVKQP